MALGNAETISAYQQAVDLSKANGRLISSEAIEYDARVVQTSAKSGSEVKSLEESLKLADDYSERRTSRQLNSTFQDWV